MHAHYEAIVRSIKIAVMPAKAGIQYGLMECVSLLLGVSFRWHDKAFLA